MKAMLKLKSLHQRFRDGRTDVVNIHLQDKDVIKRGNSILFNNIRTAILFLFRYNAKDAVPVISI